MKNSLKALIAAGVLALGFAAPAEAYPYRHGWYGPRNSITFYSGPVYRPYYPPYYYAPVYAQPVYVPPPAPPVYATQPLPVPQQVSNTDGRYCREYQRNIIVGSRLAPAYGTACMQPDGSWQIISE